MRNVKLPDNAKCMSELDKAMKYNNGIYKYEIPVEELEIIKKIYRKYDDLLGNEDESFKSILLSEETNQGIHNGYSEIQIKGRLNKLRNTLLLATNKCPYCGILPADELDHFLPQSKFKAVSIYSRNLVPICHKCNNKKRAASGINGSFFHAYFEKFPLQPIFYSDVSFINNALLIDFKVLTSHVSADLGTKLNFQFSRTDLNQRLLKESNDYLFDKKAAIELMFEVDNNDGVKKLFLKDYENLTNEYGVNYWKSALTLSLSNCDLFCKGGFKFYYYGNKPNP